MSKKQNQSLNLRNPKQMELLYTFAVCEGRLLKSQIMAVGNKELFYRMKNGGFIKETQKGSGIFKATGKLQSLTEKVTGISYGNGCSNRHSETIGKALTYLPKEVLREGRFSSGQMLKKEMESFKQSPAYEKGIQRLQRDTLYMEQQLQRDYTQKLAECESKKERYQAGIDYRADLSFCQMKKEVAFSDTPLFIPDFGVTLTRQEAESLLENMEEARGRLPEGSREARFLEADTEKVKEILQSEGSSYDLCFEIVTDSYGKPELERHHNYEEVLERTVLYIY